jgi:hypothetical protein
MAVDDTLALHESDKRDYAAKLSMIALRAATVAFSISHRVQCH